MTAKGSGWQPLLQGRAAADEGFLTGAAGIGLALLSAISPHEPEWGRLLADIPKDEGESA